MIKHWQVEGKLDLLNRLMLSNTFSQCTQCAEIEYLEFP